MSDDVSPTGQSRAESIDGDIGTLADRFDAAWLAGEQPSIEDYVAKLASEKDTETSRQVLIELVLIDLEYRWRRASEPTHEEAHATIDQTLDLTPKSPRGAGPLLEDYVQRLPMLESSDQLPNEAIAFEYRVRHLWGDRPKHDEYFQRFAARQKELAAHLAAIDREMKGREETPRRPSLGETDRLQEPRALKIRCPHCRNPVEIVDDRPLSEISCPSCGSSFGVIGDEALVHETRGGTERRRQKVAHFELLEQIGFGAFGAVWKARDTQLDRLVALKIPRRGQLSTEDSEKFIREARAAAQLRHPNVISVHEVGLEQQLIYIVSDFIDGFSLADHLSAKSLPFREAAELCATVAEALHYAHEQGVVHRDLKPSNIMIARSGSPHLMDFGLAKREAGGISVTMDGEIIGTPAYMSPEQAKGESHAADRRSDVYSLGVILFELLTGDCPFRGNMRMLLKQIIEDESPSPRKLNGQIPKDLETICLKCLEKSPAKRYATAEELADELGRYLRGEPILARPVGRTQRAWRWCRRNPTVAVLLGAVFVTLVSGIAVSTYFGMSALARSREAVAQKDRADRGEAAAQVALYESRLSETRALRMAAEPGWSRRAQENLRLNAAMEIPNRDLVELRSEAIACAGVLDIKKVGQLTASELGYVASLDFSPDGRKLACADTGGRIVVWDFRERKVVYQFSDPSYNPQTDGSLHFGKPTPCVRFHPDGVHVAYTTWNNAVDLVRVVDDPAVVQRFSRQNFPHDIAFDAVGNVLAVSWMGEVVMYDCLSQGVLTKREQREDMAAKIAVSPDGGWVAIAGSEPHANSLSVSLYDTLGARSPQTIGGLADACYSLNVGLNSRLLVAACTDNTARVFDVQRCRETARVSGHTSTICDAAFSPDATIVATASSDRTIRLTDPTSGESLVVLRTTDAVIPANLRFSPNGRFLVAAGQGGVDLYRLSHRAFTSTLGRGTILDARFHPQKDILAVTHRNAIAFWDNRFKRRERVIFTGLGQPLNGTLSFTHSGRLLVAPRICQEEGKQTRNAIPVFDSTRGSIWRTFAGMEGEVISAEFASSDRCLVVGDALGNTLIWELDSGQRTFHRSRERYTVVVAKLLESVAHVLIAYEDGTIELCDSRNSEVLTSRSLSGEIRAFAVDPAEQYVAAGSIDGEIHLLKLPRLEHVGTSELADADAIHQIAFAAESKLIVGVPENGAPALWSCPSLQKLAVLRREGVSSLDVDSSGRRLALCVKETINVLDLHNICQWCSKANIAEGLPALPDTAPQTLPTAPAFSIVAMRCPQGRVHEMLGDYRRALQECEVLRSEFPHLAAYKDWEARCCMNLAWLLAAPGDSDPKDAAEAVSLAKRALKTEAKDWTFDAVLGMAHYRQQDWRLAAEAVQRSMTRPGGLNRINFLLAALAQGQLGNEQEAREMANAASIGTDRRDGHAVAMDWLRDEVEELLDTRKVCLISHAVLQGHSERVRTVVFSPNGSLVATAAFDNTAAVWDAVTGQKLASLAGHDDFVNDVVFSPDGAILATAGLDGLIKLWDTSTWNELHTLRGHQGWVTGVVFAPNGRVLFSGGNDKTVRRWDVREGVQTGLFEGHRDSINRLAVSSDGSAVASIDWQGGLRVWDGDGEPRWILPGHGQFGLDVAFTRDGRFLASIGRDGLAKLWSMETGEELRRLVLQATPQSVAISPDGQLLAVGQAARGVVELWDVSTEMFLGEHEVHSGRVWSVAFSPDGKTLATASGDKTAMLHHVAIRPSGDDPVELERGLAEQDYLRGRSIEAQRDHAVAIGHMENAIRRWEELRTKDGERDLEYLNRIGNASVELGDIEWTRGKRAAAFRIWTQAFEPWDAAKQRLQERGSEETLGRSHLAVAERLLECGLFPEAAEHYEAAAALIPSIPSYPFLQHGLALLLSDDEERYRQVCRDAVERCGDSMASDDLRLLMILCNLLPNDLLSAARRLEMVERILSLDLVSDTSLRLHREFLFLVGLAHYRVGDYTKALVFMKRASDANRAWGTPRVGMLLANHKLGQKNEARKTWQEFAKGQKWYYCHRIESAKDVYVPWILITRIFCHEADSHFVPDATRAKFTDDPLLQLWRAHALIQIGATEMATSQIEAAVKAAPDDEAVRRTAETLRQRIAAQDVSSEPLSPDIDSEERARKSPVNISQ